MRFTCISIEAFTSGSEYRGPIHWSLYFRQWLPQPYSLKTILQAVTTAAPFIESDTSGSDYRGPIHLSLYFRQWLPRPYSLKPYTQAVTTVTLFVEDYTSGSDYRGPKQIFQNIFFYI